MNDKNSRLPIFLRGTVVVGNGRGSKDLGIPTANIDDESISKLPPMRDGVYVCVASVQGYDGIFPSATSIGTNPHYKGKKRTVEAHILHDFDPPMFHGKIISIAFIQYIREMESFDSDNDLISSIKSDIDIAQRLIDSKIINNMRMNAWFISNLT
ncbi:hypothetical protein HZS_5144 [Henneguya salminicola]|uniref:riboflavin kinase n=1 Tax=Henneguya salminicola TaxID=69463 RepID=A0A6G3MJZ2_HENSL|nr:hypothetical protein HZS_5144 [Henneguya salminicola]